MGDCLQFVLSLSVILDCWCCLFFRFVILDCNAEKCFWTASHFCYLLVPYKYIVMLSARCQYRFWSFSRVTNPSNFWRTFLYMTRLSCRNLWTLWHLVSLDFAAGYLHVLYSIFCNIWSFVCLYSFFCSCHFLKTQHGNVHFFVFEVYIHIQWY